LKLIGIPNMLVSSDRTGTAGARCQGAQDPNGEIEKFQTAIWTR
jgi:hypothetical protein